MSLFNRSSRVKAGKTTQIPATATQNRQSPLAGIRGTWKKLNSMDRKQAYTWGAVVLVSIIALLLLGSSVSKDTDDFSEFESRGYDLANMPFSTDEAEQYLLANQYPDLEGKQAYGLYSQEDKEARQQADEEENKGEGNDYGDGTGSVRDNSSIKTGTSAGRYYGSGSGRRGGGSGAKTNVGRLNSANLKNASGSGMGGTFGPHGDFSNFKSQNKGYDKAPAMKRGGNSARKALFQTAVGSRAAAGQKDNKLLNAKKSLMGGNVEGSEAFMNDSGGVDLSQAKGLNLDPNAPPSSGDLSGLDNALSDAKDDAEDDAAKEDEEEWWEEAWHRLAEQALQMVANRLINMAGDAFEEALDTAKQTRIDAQEWMGKDGQEIGNKLLAGYQEALGDPNIHPDKLGNYDITVTLDDGSTMTARMNKFTVKSDGNGGYKFRSGMQNYTIKQTDYYKNTKLPELKKQASSTVLGRQSSRSGSNYQFRDGDTRNNGTEVYCHGRWTIGSTCN